MRTSDITMGGDYCHQPDSITFQRVRPLRVERRIPPNSYSDREVPMVLVELIDANGDAYGDQRWVRPNTIPCTWAEREVAAAAEAAEAEALFAEIARINQVLSAAGFTAEAMYDTETDSIALTLNRPALAHLVELLDRVPSA